MVINNCKKRSGPIPITDPLGRCFENPTYTDNSMYTETNHNTNMMNHDYITSSDSDSDSGEKDMSQKDIDKTNESSTDTDYLDIGHTHSMLTTDF